MFCINDSSNANCQDGKSILRIIYTSSSSRSSPIFLHIFIPLKHTHIHAISLRSLLLKAGHTAAPTAQKTHTLRKSPLASIYIGRICFNFNLCYITQLVSRAFIEKSLHLAHLRGRAVIAPKLLSSGGPWERGSLCRLCVFHVSLINHT